MWALLPAACRNDFAILARCLPCKSLYSDACPYISSRAVLDITITHNSRVLSRSYVLCLIHACRTNRVAQGFGFASAADFVIQSAITRLAVPRSRSMGDVQASSMRRTQRLQVPKGSTTWGLLVSLMMMLLLGIVVTE